MNVLSRTLRLLGAASCLGTAPLVAQQSTAPAAPAVPAPAAMAPQIVEYRGYRIDVSAVAAEPDYKSVLDSMHVQIDMIERLTTADSVKVFFRSIPMAMAMTGRSASYGGGRVAIPIHVPSHYDAQHPVILHELCHAFHDKRLPSGVRNPEILKLFAEAQQSGKFPSDAYVVSKPGEYFAMMTSVYLQGAAAREPFTRAGIKEKQPAMYAWLEKMFGAM